MTDTNMERELGWEDEISQDGPGFITLPAGEYDFTVVDFERERHSGSEKLPPCNKAVVELRFDGGPLGTTTIKENLFLHSKTEGILCAFFTSIGQRKHGEPLKMNWAAIRGAKGRAKLGIRRYEKDGEPREINQVKNYIAPTEGDAGASFTPGAF